VKKNEHPQQNGDKQHKKTGPKPKNHEEHEEEHEEQHEENHEESPK